MLLGRINGVFEFMRPLSSCLNAVWSFVGCEGGSVPSLAARSEILTPLCGIQLAFTDLRSPIHPDVVCSDASMSGVTLLCQQASRKKEKKCWT